MKARALLLALALTLLPAVTFAQSKYSDIAAGMQHALVLKADGTLWAFGINENGQLGDGTTVSRDKPVKVLDNVRQISAGDCSSYAVRNDGSLWAWGWNKCGQLGDGTKTDRLRPVKIMDNVRKVVSSSNIHCAVLKTDGTLWMMGWNFWDQLGDGTGEDQPHPVRVMTSVADVSCGGRFTQAIRRDGSRWCWGDNRSGELGNGLLNTGGNEDYESGNYWYNPRKAETYGPRTISAGWEHVLAVYPDGTLRVWGANHDGQLGDGNPGIGHERLTPYTVLRGVRDAMACGFTSFAILDDGSLWGWGQNDHGQLGDGTTVSRSRPVRIRSGVRKVAAGGKFTMFLTTTGDLMLTGTIK